jgi:hypothetical protein
LGFLLLRKKRIYSRMSFYTESTPLSCPFADLGIKIWIPKDVRVRRSTKDRHDKLIFASSAAGETNSLEREGAGGRGVLLSAPSKNDGPVLSSGFGAPPAGEEDEKKRPVLKKPKTTPSSASFSSFFQSQSSSSTKSSS